MVIHKEFTKAGKEPGLQVWRIEKMDLAPIPRQYHGQFFIGDCYILLYTTSGPSYNIHTWSGKEASQDERGSAAIFMTQLDTFLNFTPVQFTESQGSESSSFMNYFKQGIQYKVKHDIYTALTTLDVEGSSANESSLSNQFFFNWLDKDETTGPSKAYTTGRIAKNGGVASGFKHVVPNAETTKRLLHVKGRRKIRATEVEFSWKSFNKGDCFIIDLGKNIYHWSGSESNMFERIKTTELAIAIRDNERSGRSDLEMIDEGSEPEEVIKVLGPKPNLPPASSDEQFEQQNEGGASLYLISDAAGSMKTTMVENKTPFKQDSLSQSECYILDDERKCLYIWKGRDASVDERKEALNTANKFIKEKNYPPNTQIQVMPAGGETTLFKQFFFNWLDKGETTGPSKAYAIGRIAKVEQIPFDASKLHGNNSMAAQHYMVDDGSGKVQIWRVEGNDKMPVDPATYGQFFGGDCYLVLYSYNTGGREKHIIYTWQGQRCTRDELGASAILTIRLDDSMGGVATQVRVTQGQEPPHLVAIFKDKPLIIHRGGTSRKSGESQPGSTRLFHIRRSSTKATRAVEVEPCAPSLNTNDVFLLKSPNSLFLWKGKASNEEEMTAAKYVADLLKGSVTELKETMESDGFWSALGGKKDYQTSPALQSTVKPPRLFGCSNKTGRLIVEEVPGDPTQGDLAPDDVMILDTWDQIFVWVGNDANEIEKTGSLKIAQDYLKSDPSGRPSIPITTIKQGDELLSFIGWFQAWDPEMWDAKKWDPRTWGKMSKTN